MRGRYLRGVAILAALACARDDDDDGADEGIVTITTAMSESESSAASDGVGCEQPLSCGEEDSCCPGTYCETGDCLPCKASGSQCDPRWNGLQDECCNGECIADTSTRGTCP